MKRSGTPPDSDAAGAVSGYGVLFSEPLSVATARVAILTSVLARHDGIRVSIRIDDDHLAQAAAAELAADVRWLGIPLGGAEAESRSLSAGDYRNYARQLSATGFASEAGDVTALLVPAGETAFDDVISGRMRFDNAALGAIVLIHADGTVDAAFAAAIDHALSGARVVVRTAEDGEGTARELRILAALGLSPPRYAHVGTLIAAPGAELPSVAYLRRAGFLPGPVSDYLARLGRRSSGDAAAPLDAEPEFSLEQLSADPVVFDEAELRRLNAQALRAFAPDELSDLVAAAMQRAGLLEEPIPAAARRWIATFLTAYGEAFTTLGEALAILAELRAEAVLVPALELERLRNRQVVFYLDAVGQYVDAQPELRDLPLDHDLAAIAAEFGIASGDALAAVRMALTGKSAGAPLELLFPLLGHDRILIRIGAISSHLLHGRGLEPIRFGPGGVPFQTIAAGRPPEP